MLARTDAATARAAIDAHHGSVAHALSTLTASPNGAAVSPEGDHP
jgi:hypothetical protein